MKKIAIVLLSGGLDSAVALYMAKAKGYDCRCLSFDYGQRHKKELESAKKIARASDSKIEIIKLKFPWKGSSLVDKAMDLPSDRSIVRIKNSGVPSTYVPGRNTIFLSMAASYAESLGAQAVFIGAHQEDSSGYPDCRREYLESFDKTIRMGTKAGLEGRLKFEFPLIDISKADIIRTGLKLGVPFELTWSCYAGTVKPCGRCDSCILRAKGFKEAGVMDPLYGKKKESKAVVTEIFSSIQGEGTFAGARQIFVRFKRCNLGCDFCDTPNKGSGKEYTVPQLVSEIKRIDKSEGPHHSISFTGGEPLLYADFLKKLLPVLKKESFRTYLETNGTLPKELKKIISFIDIVAMDFKLPSSTRQRPYWAEHLDFLRIASRKKAFVKAVVTAGTKKDDIEEAAKLIKKIDSKIPFIIQPAAPVKAADRTVSEEKLMKFFDTTLKHSVENTRIIPQLHKLLGVR